MNFSKKQSEVWTLSPFLIFCMIFEENYFSCYILLCDQIIAWFPLLCEILHNMCVAIVCEPVCDVIKFEINLIFLIKLFLCIQKSRDKNLNNLRTKKAFKEV